MGTTPKWPPAVALVGSLLGLTFAAYSTHDYIAHLDRQLHDVHCSFIPGAGAEQADNACKVAMYSPYSAVFRDDIWGGIPISTFALGAFSFFAAFSLYLLVSGPRAPRRAPQFLALAGITPALVSIGMAVISATRLGSFCKTCVGIYASSAILAAGGIAAWWLDKQTARRALAPSAIAGSHDIPPTLVDGEAPPRTLGPASLHATWLALLALSSLAPALWYREQVPSYEAYVGKCGGLATAEDPKKALLHLSAPGAVQPVTMVVDPLCPTCKAFHQRLVAEGYFPKLHVTLVLFPLDSECNWNLDTPMHPGACAVSRVVLCHADNPLAALEWGYDEQEDLLAIAKQQDGEAALLARIDQRWGKAIGSCVRAKETSLRLDEMIRFGVRNKLPVSTPQLFVGDKRLCEEDSDIGLPYALRKLAPSLRGGGA